VDLKIATYTNDIGDAELEAIWTDPDFLPGLRSFHYVRVLEIPTPRHSVFDALALGIDPEETNKANDGKSHTRLRRIFVRLQGAATGA
jgi:hypothetical protein